MTVTETPQTNPDALTAVARGWEVIPIAAGDKTPLVPWRTGGTTDLAQVEKWSETFPNCNWARLTGQRRYDSVVVVDWDGPHEALLSWLAGRSWPATFEVNTPKGRHFYFRVPERAYSHLKSRVRPLGTDVPLDVRANGGYANFSGRTEEGAYSIDNWQHPVAEMPAWLGALLLADTRQRTDRSRPKHRVPAIEATELTPYGEVWMENIISEYFSDVEGDRNARLNNMALRIGHLVAGGSIPYELAEDRLAQIGRDMGLTEKEILPTVRSGLNKGLEDPWYSDGYEDGEPLTPEELEQEAEILRHFAAESDTTDDETSRLAPASLPDEFWSSRPWLSHIREAAQSRLVSPDAVLGATLARISASTPPTVQLPPIVGGAANLVWYTITPGDPESGKSQAVKAAAEVLPLDPAAVKGPRSIGTGEGLIEAFLSTNDGGEKVVTHPCVLLKMDEGETLTQFASRTGSTIAQTLRSAWSSEELGQENATSERRRHVPAGEYSMGLTLGIQPQKAGPLFAEASGGTVQRFCWFTALDPKAPDVAPEWPGVLELPALPLTTLDHAVPRFLQLAPSIRAEITAARQAALRGHAKQADPMDAHRNLLRLKCAALLAVAEGRLEVTEDDWSLAGIIVTTSSAVRSGVQRVLDAEKRKESAKRRYAKSQDAEADVIGRGTATAKIETKARTLAKFLHGSHEVATESQLKQRLASRDRHLYEPALHLAIEKEWIVSTGDGEYRAGEGSA